MSDTIDDALMSAESVAALYDVHPKTVRAWARQGRIPRPVFSQRRFTRWRRGDVLDDLKRMADRSRREVAS